MRPVSVRRDISQARVHGQPLDETWVEMLMLDDIEEEPVFQHCIPVWLRQITEIEVVVKNAGFLGVGIIP
jgi:hypothetical protein